MDLPLYLMSLEMLNFLGLGDETSLSLHGWGFLQACFQFCINYVKLSFIVSSCEITSFMLFLELLNTSIWNALESTWLNFLNQLSFGSLGKVMTYPDYRLSMSCCVVSTCWVIGMYCILCFCLFSWWDFNFSPFDFSIIWFWTAEVLSFFNLGMSTCLGSVVES